ncbi:PucR family transcriptional regulator [Arthrobacter sp. NyZ413]|uniref:PucR family transcriptional regulator n=1 Tax=Arthrobacter sp. NyZ413 TaxID=3144669 RepID=UPI003BF9274C
MSMTVGQLVKVPTLRTRLLAGESGLPSEILWAHSCELERPWEWLGTGDLLMTTGRNVPATAATQVDFVRSLAGAGISGLVLAEGMDSPSLTPEAAALAEELAFPILETAYEIPFTALSRVVVSAGQGEVQARLNRVLRVYDAYRSAIQNSTRREQLLQRVGVELGHAIHLVDASSGRVIISAGSALADRTVAAIVERVRENAVLPGITRLQTGGDEFIILPVGTHAGWVMVADVTGVPFDVLVLQHVNTIVTIEAERLRAETESRLTVSTRLITQLIGGNVDSELVRDRLTDFGLNRGPWRVITAVSTQPVRSIDAMAALDAVRARYLVASLDDILILVTNDPDPVVRAINEIVGDGGRIGVSNETLRISGIADALRQANWAREAGFTGSGRIVYYGENRPLFLPATISDAENVVRTILGPLIDYDERNGTDLVDSLHVFFEANRSWQMASKMLQVHKQTVVYRMRRISELTGRRLDELDDIAELHLALRTLQLLGKKYRYPLVP